MHQHVGEDGAKADELAEEYGKLGVVKAVLLGMPPRRAPAGNEAVLSAARKYPRLFVPFVGFDLDEMTPDDVKRSRDQGYAGLKFIGPRKAYNDPSYFPAYHKAAELRMPVLFHLGIVANSRRWSDCDSGLMRPIHLDHIARSMPELKIIGAHLGNPWCDEAAMACRWNPNLFFDISGSTLKYRSPAFIGKLLWWTPDGPYKSPDRTFAWQKIVFGSDVSADQVSDVIHDYEKLLRANKLSHELQEQVWYGTAAKLLGVS